jgi:hypothetical protein
VVKGFEERKKPLAFWLRRLVIVIKTERKKNIYLLHNWLNFDIIG